MTNNTRDDDEDDEGMAAHETPPLLFLTVSMFRSSIEMATQIALVMFVDVKEQVMLEKR